MRAGDTTATHGANEPAAALFFDLHGSYVIAPETTLRDLVSDCHLLFLSAFGVFDEGDDNYSNAQWAAVYMLRQVGALIREISRRVPLDEADTLETDSAAPGA